MQTKYLGGRLSLLLALVLLVTFASSNAVAETVDLQEQINQLIKIIEDQGAQIKAQQKSIEKLQPQKKSATTQTKQPARQSATQKTTAAQPVGKAPEKNEQKNIPEIASLFAQPGVLTPKGTLVLEPSLQYSNSSNDRVALFGYTIIPAITIGVIDVRSVSSDTFVAAITGRYGITNRLEAEIRVPYVYRQDSASRRALNVPSGEEEVFSSSDHNLGDLEFGLRYQLNQPVSGPYYIAGLRIKSDTGQGPFDVAMSPTTEQRTELPTGSGFWGVIPSLTVMYPSDPAVFYGSIDYMWTIEEDVGHGYGDYDPGDIFGFNVGVGLALNDKASISFGYDHSIVGRAQHNASSSNEASVTQVGSFFVGGSHKLAENMSLNLSVGLGATEFAPDVQITTSVSLSY